MHFDHPGTQPDRHDTVQLPVVPTQPPADDAMRRTGDRPWLRVGPAGLAVAVLLSLLLGVLGGAVGVSLLTDEGAVGPSASPVEVRSSPAVSVSESAQVDAKTVTLTAVHSGKCLEVPDGQAQPGLRLQQRDCVESSGAQRFRLTELPGGAAVYSISVEGTGYCLVATNGALTDGSPLVQSPGCAGSTDQQFNIRTVGETGVTSPLTSAALAALTLPVTVEIVSVVSGRCVDVEGISPDAGAGVWLWVCVAQPNQRWQLTVR